METIKPIKVHRTGTNDTDPNVMLTAAEIGKLWATYMGNSMAGCVLKYFLEHVADRDIQKAVEYALQLSEQFVQTVKEILVQEKFPIPVGFTDNDFVSGTPRMFADEFYLHYMKYAAKSGASIYAVAVPIMTRSDVRHFFTNCLDSTIKMINLVNDLLIAKGFMIKPPNIPIPKHSGYVEKQNFFNGFFGHVWPLNGLQIAHLYDNIQNNATSKAILIAFSQAAKLQQARNYFIRGKELSEKHIEAFSQLLINDDLPVHPTLDHLVTNSTQSPFSDKLMLAHKLDMFAMRIRSYGNSAAVDARHDVGALYGRLILEVGNYCEDGANIMIDHGWLEQPPRAADREALALR